MQSATQLPDEVEIEQKNTLIVREANSLKIDSVVQYERGVEFKKAIKGRINDIKAEFKSPKDSASQTHKKICELEKKALGPLLEADQIVDRLLLSYIQEQREIERKAQEEARKKAEDEARRRAMEEALEMAMALDEMGKSEEVARIFEEPIQNVIPIIQTVQASIPKTTGFYSSEVFSAEVFDFSALVQAVAKGQAPLACLKADESFLNKQASALKEEFRIPGVRLSKSLRSVTRRG